MKSHFGYISYLVKEFFVPINYLLAFGVGIFIQLFQGSPLFSSAVPFLVPVFVQALSKSVLKYNNRFKDLLVTLPGKRKDPAFIMDKEGNIVTSAGKTHNFFRERNILHFRSLVDPEWSDRVLSALASSSEADFPLHFEGYCSREKQWYHITVDSGGSCKKLLVWMDNISHRKRAYRNLSSMHGFADSILTDLYRVVEDNTTFSRLASIILDFGFRAVLIARIPEKETAVLEGKVYSRKDGEISESGLLHISQAADAPVWRSRKSGAVTWDQMEEGRSEDFFNRYPFDPGVVSFIGASVENFINFHEGDISLIAFNLDHEIGDEDLLAVEIVVNTARSVSGLIDLARMNEKKFFSGVTGLCSAAEYSDEITGLHIHRVNEYSRFLAGLLGLDAQEQKWIGTVAAMHDIGKVAIPHLIKLDRAFTTEERQEMEMHVIYGYQIIERMMSCCDDQDPRLLMAAEIALNHHQRWDGSGYPALYDGKGIWVKPESRSFRDYLELRPAREDEIPLVSRIVSLADTYDALRSRRQYKPSMPHEKAVEIIRRDDRTGSSGADRFGPDVMAVFEGEHERFAQIFAGMTD